MSSKFYAVAFGHKRGIYEKWAECQEQIQGFPQPIYKKFDSREEAEKFFKERQPSSVTFDIDKKAKTFYAVARGKEAGVFTDYNLVKKHIDGFSKPLYRKFTMFDEAKSYYEKYANGVEEEDGVSGDAPKKKEAKLIARKRTQKMKEDEENSEDEESVDDDAGEESNNNDTKDKNAEKAKEQLPKKDSKLPSPKKQKTS